VLIADNPRAHYSNGGELLNIAGLGAVLATSAWLFTAIKWAGGLYLIYLGIKLLCAKTSPLDTKSSNLTQSRWRLFGNTWLVTALNPKGIIFFVAFLPQFIDPTNSATQQLWILSATFVVLAILNASIYALFAATARSAFSSPKALRRFNIGGGSLLTIAGGWALTARQSA